MIESNAHQGAGPNDEERGHAAVPVRASLARSSSSVSFAFGNSMKALLFSIFVILSAAAFAAESKKFEIRGYVIETLSDPGREEWWMPSTKPLELSRYALTNGSLDHPLIVTVLRYTNSESAKKAFELSWAGRPKAPEQLTVVHWDAAHRWQKLPRQADICLLRRRHVVVVYDLPSDFPKESTDSLLEALASSVAKAEQDGGANQSQPIRSETNGTPSAAGSRR